MKAVFLSLLMVAGGTMAFGADAASMAGKWAVHISIAGNDSDMQCTFATKDDAITGTCEGQLGELAVTGKVDGNKITWGYKSEYNGAPLTLAYQGVIDGDNMKGSVNVVEYGVDGDFSGVRAKQN